ncbi:DUF2550 domain-containing protein [Nocardiopsis aegyptia]|uniref:DUF2550 family protein n=1 Tax=Nocardiopsis aegyptia TaxID=220378 RepID=A0A7Z0EKX4_9ACTN|nr:DUF2550 domain-containing protein [Nocardiopsis aegyptia]NYJ33944.1 hypothetical protein [Nocardiopsis aegyptia]
MDRLLPGTTWFDATQWAFLALLLVLLAVVLAAFVRRAVLKRRGGAVECYLRAPEERGRRGAWRIGFGRYGTENLGWFPLFSLRPRPTAMLSRRGLVVVGRRSPDAADLSYLPADVTVLQVGWASVGDSDPEDVSFEIAMNDSTLTGFLSWMESMPPGTRWEA